MSYRIGSDRFLEASDILKRGGFVVTLKVENPEILEEWIELEEEFKQKYSELFKQLVIEVHKYLIRVTPIESGRLRGGWTSYLNSLNIDYTNQINDFSLAIKSPNQEFSLTQDAVNEGRSFSSYVEKPLSITLINSVPYGFFVEEGTSTMEARHFTSLARYKAESYMGEKTREWVQIIQNTSKIPDPKIVDEEITF